MSARDEPIDIRWIPLAKAAFAALGTQITFVERHVEAIKVKRDRYSLHSVPYTIACLELAYWVEMLETLKAVHNGRTVQPS